LTIPVPQDFIFLDPVNDIALIKIESSNVPSTAKILNVGNSDELKLGQTVIAIGNPLGTYTGSITKGIISGLNREVNISQGFFSTQSEVYEDVIQTDAAINPGNSGGPLLNLNAQVIGVNFATVDGASNLSFALPINRIQDRISELEEFGKFKIPYLGVEYRTRLVFFKGQSIVGAEIINVVNNSPAALAGINIGDIVIEFDTTDLSEKTLSALIQEHEIGSTVQVIIIRNRVEQEIKVTIGER
jgi:S1-C subfamily serine protease